MQRLVAMVVKEFWAVLRDPKARLVLVMPPLVQLFLFAFATTLDVKNVDVGVLDLSSGIHSQEIVSRLVGSPNFREVRHFDSRDAMERAIDTQQVIAAIVFDGDFDARIERGETATIGVVLDGRRSNAAQIVGAYLQEVASGVAIDMLPRRAAERAGGVVATNWFNPQLDYIWYTVPGLVAIITTVSGIALTSQSVARERELGTFDQLAVTPVRVHEILIGKLIPPVTIGMLNGMLYLILGPLVFGVPFRGSVPVFFAAMLVFQLAVAGLGLLVSAASQTQQQAFLGSFLIMVPLMLLSGYASPIDNMPDWLQVVTYANPLRYFFVILQGLFLKAMPVGDVLQLIWPMALIGLVTLSAASSLFRARME